MNDRLLSSWILVLGSLGLAYFYWKRPKPQEEASAGQGGGSGKPFASAPTSGPLLGEAPSWWAPMTRPSGVQTYSPDIHNLPSPPDQNNIPWPPEAMKEFMLPDSVKQQHFDAQLRAYQQRSSLDAGESQLAQEVG